MGLNLASYEEFKKTLTDEENRFLEPERKAYFVHPGYADTIFWLCWMSKAKNIVEIGVGHSTIPLLLAARRNEAKLFSTDIACESHEYTVKELWKYPHTENWTVRCGIDSLDMAKQWQGGEIDFLYLDSSHAYEHTKKELDAWMPLVKVGGWMMCHDVTSNVDLVFRAISEFIMRRDNKFFYEYYHLPDYYGFGVLVKRNLNVL